MVDVKGERSYMVGGVGDCAPAETKTGRKVTEQDK